MKRILRYDQIELNPVKISQRNDDKFGGVTTFHDIVIAREIVHQYDDGMAYKPADELEHASWTAEGRWVVIGKHPTTAVVASRNDIGGRTVNVRYTKSLNDPKTKRPNNRGVLADLEIFDNKISPDDIKQMKNGTKSDVSIGFFFDEDTTPGTIEEDGHPLNGATYDYVQRNIMIDHTAAGLDAGSGRCTVPYCGIGADGIDGVITGDPFGGYENFDQCVSKNQDKDDPEAYCASIMRKVEEKDKLDVRESISMEKVEELKSQVNDVLSALDNLVEEEYQGNATNETLSQRAKMFFSISDDEWLALSEEEKNGYIGKLPPAKPVEGATNKDTWSITKDEFHELTKERQIAFLDFLECDDCVEDWEIDPDLREEETPEVVPEKKSTSSVDEVERARKLLAEL